jgi:ATP-dependent DNA helicase RecQ
VNLESAKAVLGITELKAGQDRVINAVLAGHDVLAVFPTGWGKSACFQIPALMSDGLTVVFSPLIALMKDQVDGLRRRGVKAARFDSTLNAKERREVEHELGRGEVRLLYMAPERLRNEEWISRYVACQSVRYVVIDEAHCLERWGKDFRTAYRLLPKFIRRVQPDSVIAMTATATEETEKAVRGVLRDTLVREYVVPLRENLSYSNCDRSIDGLLEWIGGDLGKRGIIYCGAVATTVGLAGQINRALGRDVAASYNGKMGRGERNASQDAFSSGGVTILCATNAFGMGVDVPDIRFIIHWDLPGTVDDYVQESGRAGRDGLPSRCGLCFSGRGLALREFQVRERNPYRSSYEKVFAALAKRGRGEIRCPSSVLSSECGVSEGEVQTVLRVLAAEGVLARFPCEERGPVVSVRAGGGVTLSGRSEEVWRFLIGAIEDSRDGRVALRDLSVPLHVSDVTIRGYLVDFRDAGLIDVEWPYHGSVTVVCKPTLMSVDWAALEVKAVADREKLERMKALLDCACEERPAFIEAYFRDSQPSLNARLAELDQGDEDGQDAAREGSPDGIGTLSSNS